MRLDSLRKVHRDNVDVETAFSSQLRRADIDRAAGMGPPDLGRPDVGSGGPLGRGLSRIARPILRPFVVRMRTVLLGPLEEEVRQNRRRTEEIWQHVKATDRRVAVSTGPDRVLVRTEVGYVLCSSDDVGTLAILIERGDLEPGTRQLIERLLSPGDLFVDVGANLGLHTLAAGRAMQREGRIVAVEPFPRTAELLRETVFINGLSAIVEIHPVAASDHEGQATLHLGPVSGHHSLLPLTLPPGRSPASIEVPLVTLDALLADAPPPALVKVDVEGAELEVVEGARGLLERSPDVGMIVEYGPLHLERAGRSTTEWFGRFASLDLTFREIDADTGRLYERTIESLSDVESANLLFARPDAEVWRKAAR